MSEEFMLPVVQQNNIFTTEVRGTQFTYYITGPIREPENYVDLCNILRSAGPQDEVIIRLNSRGGLVSSERMIVNAIEESQALVRGFIEYDCMSAATGIFLACTSHGWGKHIQFMAHCSWWGAIGKNPDIKSQTEFGIKQMEEEIVATYKGLLTDSELAQCNDGKEFWFGAKELEERMTNYYEYVESQGCGNPDCMECGQQEEDFEMPTLDTMIADAVAQGIEQYEKKKDAAEKKAARKKPSAKTQKALNDARVKAEAFKEAEKSE